MHMLSYRVSAPNEQRVSIVTSKILFRREVSVNISSIMKLQTTKLTRCKCTCIAAE